MEGQIRWPLKATPNSKYSMIVWFYESSLPLVVEQVLRLRKPVVLCGQPQKSGLFVPSETSGVQFLHIMWLKKKLTGSFSQKINCPGYSSIILSSAVGVVPYWSSVVSQCLFWMKSPLAISLNEILIRCLISTVTAGTCWKADNSFFSGWGWLCTVWACQTVLCLVLVVLK